MIAGLLESSKAVGYKLSLLHNGILCIKGAWTYHRSWKHGWFYHQHTWSRKSSVVSSHHHFQLHPLLIGGSGTWVSVLLRLTLTGLPVSDSTMFQNFWTWTLASRKVPFCLPSQSKSCWYSSVPPGNIACFKSFSLINFLIIWTPRDNKMKTSDKSRHYAKAYTKQHAANRVSGLWQVQG